MGQINLNAGLMGYCKVCDDDRKFVKHQDRLDVMICGACQFTRGIDDFRDDTRNKYIGKEYYA